MPTSRPRGRPRVPDEARKRNNVTIRMRDEIKSRIEQSAAAHQRSISEEIESRLERSMAEEDQVGGPEMLATVNLMAGAFLRGGQRGAQACGHPEWTTADWLNDPFCYRAAVQAVLDALEIAQPVKYESKHPDPAQLILHRDLHDFFASVAARGGAVKLTRGEKK